MRNLLINFILLLVLIILTARCKDCHNHKRDISILHDKYTLEMNDTFHLITKSYFNGESLSHIDYQNLNGLRITVAIGDLDRDPNNDWQIYSKINLNKKEDILKAEIEVSSGFRKEFIYLKDFDFYFKFITLSFVFHNSRDDKDYYVFISNCEFDEYTLQVEMSSNEDKYSFGKLDRLNKYFLKNIKIKNTK